jgi:quinol monooxygenase YgiN
LTAGVKAKEGEEDKVKEALSSLVEPTRKEEGCIHDILHQAANDKTKFMFYEVWASREALKQHGQAPQMKALRPKLKGLTEPDVTVGVTFYQPVE